MADIVLTKVKGGSTTVFWSNDSLPYNPCPNDQLKRLKDTVFYSDSSIRDDVVRKMAEADFILHKVGRIFFVKLNLCIYIKIVLLVCA